MARPATAHIRLDAFRHNYQLAKKLHGGSALAVIKANAYGHGALQCAQAIANEADGFAVACLEEALQLRQASIHNPILLLEGFFEVSELPEIVVNDLWIAVHAMWQVEILLSCKLAKPVHVWLKLDSGMHRLGLTAKEYKNAYALLNQHVNVIKIVLMSHFANADDLTLQLSFDLTKSALTNPNLRPNLHPNLHPNLLSPLQQISHFSATVSGLNLTDTSLNLTDISLANSAAILAWPQAKGMWSRPGIMLYGANPIDANLSNTAFSSKLVDKTTEALRPVMQFTSTIISMKNVSKNAAIGYGSIFTAKRDTLVGVVACGYADGYPRSAGAGLDAGAPIAVEGQITKVIGRVSMDMLMVDLTHISSAHVGSSVELWGDQVQANAVANAAGTIAYELFCNVKRVQFSYSDTNQSDADSIR